MTRPEPKYKVDDYLIIYSGSHEGCCFYVRDVRWSTGGFWKRPGWEYDTGSYGWKPENTICTERHARVFP